MDIHILSWWQQNEHTQLCVAYASRKYVYNFKINLQIVGKLIWHFVRRWPKFNSLSVTWIYTMISDITKNSSGDEIANVNFSYDHIVEYSTRRRPWRREWVWPRCISAEGPQGETFGNHWIFMCAPQPGTARPRATACTAEPRQGNNGWLNILPPRQVNT